MKNGSVCRLNVSEELVEDVAVIFITAPISFLSIT